MEWLITLLVLLVVFVIVFYVIDLLPGDPKLKQLIKLVAGLILLIYLISVLFGVAPGPPWHKHL